MGFKSPDNGSAPHLRVQVGEQWCDDLPFTSRRVLQGGLRGGVPVCVGIKGVEHGWLQLPRPASSFSGEKEAQSRGREGLVLRDGGLPWLDKAPLHL